MKIIIIFLYYIEQMQSRALEEQLGKQEFHIKFMEDFLFIREKK